MLNCEYCPRFLLRVSRNTSRLVSAFLSLYIGRAGDSFFETGFCAIESREFNAESRAFNVVRSSLRTKKPNHLAVVREHCKRNCPNECSFLRCSFAKKSLNFERRPHFLCVLRCNLNYLCCCSPIEWGSSCCALPRMSGKNHSCSQNSRCRTNHCRRWCRVVPRLRLLHTDVKAHNFRCRRVRRKTIPRNEDCCRLRLRNSCCRYRSSILFRRNVLRQCAKVRYDSSCCSLDLRSVPRNCRAIRRNGSLLRANHSRANGIPGDDSPNLNHGRRCRRRVCRRRSDRGRNSACRR